MSLNFSSWACHFTTTANLTRCAASSGVWRAFVKRTDGSSTYEKHDQHYLSHGNDVAPAEFMPASSCRRACSQLQTCAGFTFEEAGDGDDVLCYLKATASGLRSSFHLGASTNCVAPGGTTADLPVCSPLPGEMGLGGYYGHYQGHWLSSTAFLVNATGNATVNATAAANVALLGKVMDAWKAKYPSMDGYLFPFDPVVWDKLLAGNGAGPYYSVPFYTLHKLMAGLLDQYTHAGNLQARDMVIKMANWVHVRVEAVIAGPGGMALWQKVLLTEWGGMNDVLFHLYEYTGNPTHLATARRFNGFVFTARLAAGEDDLGKLPFPHANFHLPEVVGNARAYELTGNKTDKAIVETFFNALVANHSYATGGSNSGECWQDARDLAAFLDDQTEESCTQYNVLKVARRAFLTSADATYADFYERAILNGIVGNQNKNFASSSPTSSAYIYMLPMGGANLKPWGSSTHGFPCCWGTLSESFAKLGDSIFFTRPAAAAAGDSSAGSPALYVNLFVTAVAKLDSAGLHGVSVSQKATFPVDPIKTTTLTVGTDKTLSLTGAIFTLMLRVPDWATSPHNKVTVNGVAVDAAAIVPGSFLALGPRTWRGGDVVQANFPPTLKTMPLSDKHADQNATFAFMYGPLVLAGVHRSTDIFVPKGGTAAARADPSCFIRRNSTAGAPLEFEAVAADGSKMKMIPLKEVMEERYVVYFFTAGTKPAQPKNPYCPHSQGAEANGYFDEGAIDDEHEQDLVSAGPPVPSPSSKSGQDEYATIDSRSRGVTWRLVDGQLLNQ